MKTNNTNIANIVFGFFLLWPVVLLVVPGGHYIGPFLLALATLFVFKRVEFAVFMQDTKLKQSWVWLVGGFLTYAVIKIFLGWYHGNNSSYFEKIIPFVLFPFLGWLIVKKRWCAQPWLMAVATGAIAAFAYALMQVFVWDIPRAFGAGSNPIPFGNTAIAMAGICVVAAVRYPFDKNKLRFQLFLFTGALCGMGASLLSGSKGGWLSLLLIGVLVGFLVTVSKPLWQRLASTLVVLSVILGAGFFAPDHLVKDRLISGVEGGLKWIKTGEVTEWSVSMRFEVWKLSSRIISERPLLGHGQEGVDNRWPELIRSGYVHPELAELVRISPHYRTADNEILDTLKAGGVVGLAAILALYVGVWRAFWVWRDSADRGIKTLSVIGCLLVALFLEFGLSVSVMGINVFRSVFISFSVALLAFITVRHLRAPTGAMGAAP